jgi:hypothetical protein
MCSMKSRSLSALREVPAYTALSENDDSWCSGSTTLQLAARNGIARHQRRQADDARVLQRVFAQQVHAVGEQRGAR